MGKWSSLKKQYPQAEDEDGLFEAAVKKAMAEFGNLDPKEAMTAYEYRCDVYDEHDLVIKGLNVEFEALSRILCNRFEAMDTTSLNTAGGRCFYVNDDVQPKVISKDELNAWLKEKGMDGLRTLNAQTLKSLTKAALEDRDCPMPKGIEIKMRTQIKMRKS